MNNESTGGTVMANDQVITQDVVYDADIPEMNTVKVDVFEDVGEPAKVQDVENKSPFEDQILDWVREDGIDGALERLAGGDEVETFENPQNAEEIVDGINYPDDQDFRKYLLDTVNQKLRVGERVDPDAVLDEAKLRFERSEMIEDLSLEDKLLSCENLIQELNELKNGMAELNLKIEELEQSLYKLAEAFLLMLKKKKEEEKGKRQKSWLELMIMVVAALMQEIVEAGTNNKSSNKKDPK